MTSLGASGLEYANDSSMWTVTHAPYGHGHELPEEVPRRYATSLSTYYNGLPPSTTSTGRSFPSPAPMKGKNLAHVTTLLSDRIREMQTDAPVECSGAGDGNGNRSPGM